MIKIKVLALLLLMSGANSLSMEREKAYEDVVFDGFMKCDDFDFRYTNGKIIKEHIQTKVEYKIPDCMPAFCILYKYKGEWEGRDWPRHFTYLPLSCLFINRKEANSQVIISAIVERKEHAFKLVKSLAEDDSNLLEHENNHFVFIDSQYKKFIKNPEQMNVRAGLCKIKSNELVDNRIIQFCKLKKRRIKKGSGKAIMHGSKGYLAFMKELSDEKKLLYELLVAVEKECKDKTSYFSLLPKDVIPLLKNFMQDSKIIEWAHLDPLSKYHEQALKEIEQEKEIIQIL